MSGSGSLPPPAAPSAASSPPSGGASNDYDFDLSVLTRSPSFTEKLWEKTKKDPLVPIGLSATVFALSGGLMSMVNSSRNSNKWMQARVAAQAFTLVAVLASLYSAGRLFPRPKDDEAEEALEQEEE